MTARRTAKTTRRALPGLLGLDVTMADRLTLTAELADLELHDCTQLLDGYNRQAERSWRYAE